MEATEDDSMKAPEPDNSTSSTGRTAGNAVRVTLPMGLRYSLQTHTLRRYGLNDAFDRSVTRLIHHDNVSRAQACLKV